jgi:flavin reductase (DIM6/NTAB) family NADH-FMN oxidoreductase RutF
MQSHPPSADAYKHLARAWAATVTVVTARRAVPADLGDLDGFTATAFFTVSINPPIIVVSVTTASNGHAMLRECAGFAVNLLAPGQSEIAAAFAKPHAERAGIWERFGWLPDHDGVPLLGGATGAFSARVRQLVDAGDHTLVLGDVTAIHHGEGHDTLVYHNRAYGRVERQG